MCIYASRGELILSCILSDCDLKFLRCGDSKVSEFAGNLIFYGSHSSACVWNFVRCAGSRFAQNAKVEVASGKTASVHSGGVLVHQFNGCVYLRKVQWQRVVLILALFPALLALNSCGGGSSTTAATPTITISCAATSVVVNGTVQCTQSILNLSSTLVNWQAGGVAGGNSTFGTIDTNGKSGFDTDSQFEREIRNFPGLHRNLLDEYHDSGVLAGQHHNRRQCSIRQDKRAGQLRSSTRSPGRRNRHHHRDFPSGFNANNVGNSECDLR